jgi:hypothetical protein
MMIPIDDAGHTQKDTYHADDDAAHAEAAEQQSPSRALVGTWNFGTSGPVLGRRVVTCNL